MIGETVRVSRLRFTIRERRAVGDGIMQIGRLALARGGRAMLSTAAYSEVYTLFPLHYRPRVLRFSHLGFSGETAHQFIDGNAKWCFSPGGSTARFPVWALPFIEWDFYGQAVSCNGLYLKTADDDYLADWYRQPVSWTLDGVVHLGGVRVWMRLIDARFSPPLMNARWYNHRAQESTVLNDITFPPIPFRPTLLTPDGIGAGVGDVLASRLRFADGLRVSAAGSASLTVGMG